MIRGRRPNKGFENLHFKLIRVLVNNRRKYYALCLKCNTELKNTSESRLQIHSNKCKRKNRGKSLENEAVFEDSDLDPNMEFLLSNPTIEMIDVEGLQDSKEKVKDSFIGKTEDIGIKKESKASSCLEKDPPDHIGSPKPHGVTFKLDLSELKNKNSDKAISKLGNISHASANRDQDEFDIYGRHIASQLRAMPAGKAVYCQEKIEEILTEERLCFVKSEINDN
ncbi:uncharacterized protein LOC115886564 [Sitophilus oryzae]|uniref:Uncharacterized protein LOC115886564 n=1 Tax=Sitophilus oryzae TaxID=7048 RepID=A0A6J2YE64_SITOR|nr:uncharacterized protein LOC115886564 [Sitophilus oryzae]